MIDASVHTIGRRHTFQLTKELTRVLKTAKRVPDSCKGEVGNTLAVGQKYQEK